MVSNKPHISRLFICKALGLSRSATYYKHILPHRDKPWLDKIMKVLVHNPDYGIYRLKIHFELQGEVISQSKIRRICRANGIQTKHRTKKPKSRDRNLPHSGIPNLVKCIVATEPNHIWCGDFTYLQVADDWVYLATVIDVYTKEIIGFSLSTNHTAELVCRALGMAIRTSRKPTFFHSDPGSEYSSAEFRYILNKNNIIQSNSEKCSPWQNGFQESFYGKFKKEAGYYRIQSCRTYMEIYNLIVQRIQYYNHNRIHTTIRNIPARFYQQWLAREENKVS